jgi:DNA-binding NarL/FixJ family response regulator
MIEAREAGAVAVATSQVRVVVVDDQVLLREGVASLLRRDPRIAVVGMGANGHDAIDLTGTLRPDVVLIDIRMPGLDGIGATREIKSRWPQVRVMILTSLVEDGLVIEGLDAGASGYILKDATPDVLIADVLAVAAGGHVMHPGVARQMASLLGKQNQARKDTYEGLTQRELQILSMLARGMAAKEIARSVHISEKTVRNHLSHIYSKLGIFDRSQLILWAIRKGLASLD